MFAVSPALSTVLAICTGANSSALAAGADGGKGVYDKSCAGCHGADGKGNEKMAKVLGDKGLNIVGSETKKKSTSNFLN